MAESADLAPFLEAGFTAVTVFRSLVLHRSLLRTYSDLLDLLFQGRGFHDASDA